MSRQIPILRGRIDQGVLVWSGIDGKRFETAKQFLEQQEFELTIQKRRKKATGPQRRYYFAVIVAMIAEAAGYNPDDPADIEAVHQALKLRFLRRPGDGPIQVARSTESLTTVEKEAYHATCRQFGAQEFGIYIPLPHEVLIEH